MKLDDLKTKLRAIHSLITDALMPRGPGAASILELIEQAEDRLENLEAELVLDPPSLGRKLELMAPDEIEKENSARDARATPLGRLPAQPGTTATILPDFDAEMVASFETGFSAEVYLWDAITQRHYTRPDAKTRLDTLKAYLSYRLGMPPQMRLSLDVSFRDQQAEMIAMARTPTGRNLLLKGNIIDEAWIAEHLPESQK